MKVDCRLYLSSLLGVCLCTPIVPGDNKCLGRETFPLPGRGCHHPLSTEPCDEGEWAVLTSSSILSCELIPCENDDVMFGGRCVNMYDTEACPDVGERLFWDDHGEGVCDCDDGWGRGEDGRCYQEFTRGFCQENSIIRIREEVDAKTARLIPGRTRLLGRSHVPANPNHQLTCEDNPCGDHRISLPHT